MKNTGTTSQMASQTYKKYTHREHILARPDTYIGSVNNEESDAWILEDNVMKEKHCSLVPGLIKIFDEILVNAMDQCAVQKGVDRIQVV